MASCKYQSFFTVGVDTQQGGSGIDEVEALADCAFAGMRRHIQLARIVARRVGNETCFGSFCKLHCYGGPGNPLAAEHIKAERTAEPVYPFVLFGQGESHPRTGIGEPAVATVQCVGSVGYVQNIVEGVPLFGNGLAA